MYKNYSQCRNYIAAKYIYGYDTWNRVLSLHFIDPPIDGVSCGGHSAPTCAECPRGNGAGWCNGQCDWDYTESVCFKPGIST